MLIGGIIYIKNIEAVSTLLLDVSFSQECLYELKYKYLWMKGAIINF